MTHRDSRGALVLSLDFELAWGVREQLYRGGGALADLHGARSVVPRLLRLFEEFDVAATWAAVGFLFARDREELAQFAPRLKPEYVRLSLRPYDEPVGRDESEDPLHFGGRLLDLIAAVPRQEIATHTYSHYYCGEAGQTRETFREDLRAARRIATERGVRIRSIVFPRNQHNPDYDDILLAEGIHAYRGNPRSSIWRFSHTAQSASTLKRAGRLLDTYVPLTGEGGTPWDAIAQPSGLSDVRATGFLAPYRPALRRLEGIRLRRIRGAIRSAARTGQIVHYWWHPHNFGHHQHENLSFLRAVLQEFAICREQFGMQSLSMGGVDLHVRGKVTRPETRRSA